MKTSIRISTVSTLGIFSGAFSTAQVSAYLPEMIRWFGYSEKDKGYYASIFVVLFSIGTCVSSCGVTSISDVKGRKLVLLALHLLNAITNFAFGFCQHLTTSLLLRIVVGTCTAVISISRGLLAIFSTNRSHSFALSLGGLSWSIGHIAGMYIGGLLASPARRYPESLVDFAFFVKFPYFLPSFLASLVSLTAASTTFFLYPNESGSDFKDMTEEPTEISTILPSEVTRHGCYSALSENQDENTNENRESYSQKHSQKKEEVLLLSDTVHKNIPETDHTKSFRNEISESKLNCITYQISEFVKNNSMVKLLRNDMVMKSLPMFVISKSVTNAFTTLFAVWASTVPSLGGLNYSSAQIGTVMALGFLPNMAIQLCVIPRVERIFGARRISLVCSAVVATVVTSIPMCRVIFDPWQQWTALVCLQCVFQNTSIGSSICLNVLVNNSVFKDESLAINCLARSLCHLAKIVFTPLICAVFAASIVTTSPFDYNVAFVWLGAMSWIAAVLVLRTPTSLDTKLKKIYNAEDSDCLSVSDDDESRP